MAYKFVVLAVGVNLVLLGKKESAKLEMLAKKDVVVTLLAGE